MAQWLYSYSHIALLVSSPRQDRLRNPRGGVQQMKPSKALGPGQPHILFLFTYESLAIKFYLGLLKQRKSL